MIKITEDEAVRALTNFLIDCDAEDVAKLLGDIFGGDCEPVEEYYGDIYTGNIIYNFKPNEFYLEKFLDDKINGRN
jgi:hypothetical protein